MVEKEFPAWKRARRIPADGTAAQAETPAPGGVSDSSARSGALNSGDSSELSGALGSFGILGTSEASGSSGLAGSLGGSGLARLAGLFRFLRAEGATGSSGVAVPEEESPAFVSSTVVANCRSGPRWRDPLAPATRSPRPLGCIFAPDPAWPRRIGRFRTTQHSGPAPTQSRRPR